jgi:hypothetical protein
VLDNSVKAGLLHLSGLAALNDGHSTEWIGRVARQGGGLRTKRCLEIGAGSGSIAFWLSVQVGTFGQVIATDLDVSRIPVDHPPNVLVVPHDLNDGPVPVDRPVDLVHARMVLAHLNQRDQVLAWQVETVAPDGLVLVEDLYAGSDLGRVLAAPTPGVRDLYTRYLRCRGEVFAAAGVDRSWAPGLPDLFTRLGLTSVDVEVWSRSWRGGEPASRHALGTLLQVAPRLHANGQMTEDETEAVAAALDDPRLQVLNPPLYSVSGRVPHRTANRAPGRVPCRSGGPCVRDV